MLPFLIFLDVDIEIDWVKKHVPKYKPLGARKRIQTVVEMVYLENSDDEDDEDSQGYTLDDLLNGTAIYDEFSDNIKKEASELTSKKDPHETFMEVPEDKCIQLAPIKIPDIKAEEDDEDCFIIPKTVRTERSHTRSGKGTGVTGHKHGDISPKPKFYPVKPPANYSHIPTSKELMRSSKIVPFKARYVSKSTPGTYTSITARHVTERSGSRMVAIKPLKRI